MFEIERGTSRIIRELHEGNMPLIAAARAEQGVAGLFDVPAEYEDTITVSCNGAGCGSTFFHEGKFAITGDASVLIPHQRLSKLVLLFLTSIFDTRFSSTYSYEEKCGPASLATEKVLLPATTDGSPDWDYMEAYMRKVMEREETYAAELERLQ